MKKGIFLKIILAVILINVIIVIITNASLNKKFKVGTYKEEIVEKYGKPDIIIYPYDLDLTQVKYSYKFPLGYKINIYRVKSIWEKDKWKGIIKIPARFDMNKEKVKEIFVYDKKIWLEAVCFDNNNRVLYSFSWD